MNTPPSSPSGGPYYAPAPERSFVTPAIITLILYWILWLPGLIANIYYLSEARKAQNTPGQVVTGVGCLWALLIVALAGVIVSACSFVLLMLMVPTFAAIFR